MKRVHGVFKRTTVLATLVIMMTTVIHSSVFAADYPEFYLKVVQEGKKCNEVIKKINFEEQDFSLLPSETNSEFDTSEKHSGEYSLHLTGSKDQAITFKTPSYTFQGKMTYDMSVWIKATNLKNEDPSKEYVTISSYNTGRANDYITEFTGDWQLYEIKNHTMGSGSTNTYLNISLPKGTTGDLWIDDITITKVREPDTTELAIINHDFSDVPEDFWAYNSIANLYNNGIISGKSEELFAPDGIILKEEFAKIAVLAAIDKKSDKAGTFSDVAIGSWCEPFIETANEAKIIDGKADGIFGVGEKVTRQEAAVTLARIMTLKGLDSGAREEGLKDFNEIPEYARESVAMLLAAGFIDGDTEGNFNPTALITRAEMCVIIDRMNIIRNRFPDLVYRSMPKKEGEGEVIFEESFNSIDAVTDNEKLSNRFVKDEGNFAKGCLKVKDGEYEAFGIAMDKASSQGSISMIINVYVKSELEDVGAIILKTSTINADGSVKKTSGTVKAEGNTEGWKKLSMTLSESNGFSSLKMFVEFENAEAGDIYIDDINVTVAKHSLNAGLLLPNYKGLIYEENGENDIVLQTWVEKDYVKEKIEDVKLRVEILDINDFVVLESENGIVEKRMNVTFSSKYLDYGDYALKTTLISKIDGREIDSVRTILRKRTGQISDLKSYIDKDGVYIQDGKRRLLLAAYGAKTPTDTKPYEFLKGSALDKFIFYWAGTRPVYNETFFELTEKYDVQATGILRLFEGRTDIAIKTIPEERTRIEDAVNELKDNDSIWGWYLHDEPNTYQYRDRMRWHHEIVSSLDLTRPTFFCDNKYTEINSFTHNFSTDAFGEDNYTIKFDKDDNTIGRQTGFVKAAKKGFINKPIWHVLQMYNATVSYGGNDPTWRAPSEDQQRNMAYQVLCSGGTGIVWYSISNVYDDFLGTDPNILLARTMNATNEIKEYEDIIVSPEEPPVVKTTGSSSWLGYLPRRYEGKTYLMLVNRTINPQSCLFRLAGAKSAVDLRTGKSFEVDEDGTFQVDFDNIEVFFLEIEQDEYLSNDATIKNVAFNNGEESYMIRETNEGYIVDVPEDVEEMSYSVMCNDIAKMLINCVPCEKTGRISTDKDFKIILVSEDEKNTQVLNVKVNKVGRAS